MRRTIRDTMICWIGFIALLAGCTLTRLPELPPTAVNTDTPIPPTAAPTSSIPSATPPPTASATPAATFTPNAPQAAVTINELNVRRGPGTNFTPALGTLNAGDVVTIVAVNPARTWYKISFNGQEAWISASSDFVSASGNIDALPKDFGPPTPTPIPVTPTPIPPTLDTVTNYLQDGSFEGAYSGRGAPDFNIPAAWNVTVYESPRDYDWQNLRPYAFPHRTAPEIQNGGLALNISRDYATFTLAMYQQVNVPANINMTASVWAWLHTCDGEVCRSEGSSGAKVRLGIDPTGGTNAFGGNVVWSGFITPHDSWGNVGVQTRAQGSTVTVFIYTTQDVPKAFNQLYLDNAVLNVGG